AADFETIEELDDGVMLECEVVGEDLHARLAIHRTQREEELMLARLETDRARGGFRERDERPEMTTKAGERPVMGVADGLSRHGWTIYRDAIYLTSSDRMADQRGITYPSSRSRATSRRPVASRSLPRTARHTSSTSCHRAIA